MHHACIKQIYAIADHASRRESAFLSNRPGLYKFAASKLNNTKPIAPLLRPDGTVTTDQTEKCQLLLRQFSSVFTTDNGILPDFPSRTTQKCNTVLFPAFEVCKLLRKLPNKISQSPDNIPPLLLRGIANYLYDPAFRMCQPFCICELLSKIFTVCFHSGVLPSVWLTAIVVPIYKKGDSSIVSRYYFRLVLTQKVSFLRQASRYYVVSVLRQQSRSYAAQNQSEISLLLEQSQYYARSCFVPLLRRVSRSYASRSTVDIQ